MPQFLPFKESISKERIENNELKENDNNTDILYHMMKDKLDSIGNEVQNDYTKLIHLNDNDIELKGKKKCEEEGYNLGKLIMQNNQVKMMIGDYEFEILDSVNSQFYQELCAIDVKEKSAKPKLFFLSQINKKFACKPNLSNILK